MEKFEVDKEIARMLEKRKLRRARLIALYFAFISILAVGSGTIAFRQHYEKESIRVDADFYYREFLESQQKNKILEENNQILQTELDNCKSNLGM